MDRRTADKMAARGVVGGSAGLILLIISVLIMMNAGAFTRPSDIHVTDPTATVREARLLIERKRSNGSSFGDSTEPKDLPPALRIEKLRYANVHVDHVDLVVARNPDVSIGARIWAVHHRPHRDQQTRYRDIWFYRYNNDGPESLTNIP